MHNSECIIRINALKGQKHIAQGSALGMNTSSNHALQGQQNNMDEHL